ncbi:sensor histidine kinase [Desulfonatronum thioautotrophicum]|uniref:sensor histidine kinase n=1 Tax=Desulfonatronum thioautotrophicum TaxID=617001 RepID=UPI00069C7F56|nr:ATP-binding protein [Desulfonatronum thioautotrophicum]
MASMSDDIRRQILLEIALSISGALVLRSLLGKCLPLFLRKLNCTAAAVVHLENSQPVTSMALPLALPQHPDWPEVVQKLSTDLETDSDRMISEYQGRRGPWFGFRLPGFGLLVLARQELFDALFLKDFLPLTDMLARACLACLEAEQRRRVEAQLKRHQEQLELLVQERTRDLQASLEQLKATQTQLLHAEKLASIGQLAAGIAHEINTPAQFVGDNAQFLRQANTDLARVLSAYHELLDAVDSKQMDADLPARVRRIRHEADVDFLMQEAPLAIAQILDGVERISKIVSSMREFAHPGSSEKKPADINKALENTVIVARNEWKYVADMEMDLDPDLPAVSCLPNEINQVFLNVLVNAGQAVRAKVRRENTQKGLIRISTRRIGECAEIRISDTGSGIPEGIRDRIFDPFFTTKEVGQGTGQGLAIAYNVVVDKHQGEIFFESRGGEGTTFVIRLPIGA